LTHFFFVAAKKFGWSLNEDAISSMTRGYVGDTQFAVLPTVEPVHTMIITVIVQLVMFVAINLIFLYLFETIGIGFLTAATFF
jgi:hypothetical protein